LSHPLLLLWRAGARGDNLPISPAFCFPPCRHDKPQAKIF